MVGRSFWSFKLAPSLRLGVAFAKFTAVLLPAFSESNVVVRVGGITVSMAQLLAIGVIVALTWLNTRGIRIGTLVQNVFTFGKIGSLVVLILLAVIGYNHVAIEQNLATFWDASRVAVGSDGSVLTTALSGIGLVVALAVAQVGSLFSSDGWNNITFAAGEVVRPRRTIPLALTLGTVIVTVLYLLVNVAYIVTLPVRGVPNGATPLEQGIQFAVADRVGAAAAEVMFPGIGAMLMAVLIMISTFGCDNGMILAGARCYYAMARDGLFFASVGRLNRFGAPATALWVQAHLGKCALPFRPLWGFARLRRLRCACVLRLDRCWDFPSALAAARHRASDQSGWISSSPSAVHCRCCIHLRRSAGRKAELHLPWTCDCPGRCAGVLPVAVACGASRAAT